MDEVEDLSGYGPAMLALGPKPRRFVLAMAADPFGSAASWARAAGYSDTGGAAKVRAHHLLRNPRVEAAVFEVGRSQLFGVGPILASAVLLRTAANPKHPQHLRAAEMIANRVGLHEKTEHHVSVSHTDRTGVVMLERIKELAGVLGVDAAKLLGPNAAPGAVVIEHEPRDGG
jgi:hypothetical protein